MECILEKQSIEEFGEYLFDNTKECIAGRVHNISCDNDGFCNACGYQEENQNSNYLLEELL